MGLTGFNRMRREAAKMVAVAPKTENRAGSQETKETAKPEEKKLSEETKPAKAESQKGEKKETTKKAEADIFVE